MLPFARDEHEPPLIIFGSVGKRSHIFTIDYRVVGRLMDVDIPAAATLPSRRDGLWEGTCFEFFLALRETSPYWEFNLSPAGHWNVYRFNAYRQGMREEAAITSMPFSVRREPELVQVSLELELKKIGVADGPLDVGISGVVRHKRGHLEHHALAHPAPRADFHRRDGFIITL